LATERTNIFNATSGLTQSMQLRLQVLALSGDSPVSNAFTDEAERLGLTSKGREKKEREADRRFQDIMQVLRERAAEFRKELDLLEHATAEALHENEEQLRVAREDLKWVRDRAYEITMPDGTIAKVYRDGDRVRDDAGAFVTEARADEIPASASSWAQRKASGDTVARLQNERRDLLEYQERVSRTKETLASGETTPEEFDALKADIGHMPASVQRRFQESVGGSTPIDRVRLDERPATFDSSARPTRDFAPAAAGMKVPVSDDRDFMQLPPSVSAPAPR
jgi:hypothetical protein